MIGGVRRSSVAVRDTSWPVFRALLLVFALLLPMVARAEDAEAVVRDIVAQDEIGRAHV